MHKNVYCKKGRDKGRVLGFKCLNSKEGQESHDLYIRKQYTQSERNSKRPYNVSISSGKIEYSKISSIACQ
jgi:hypothetical protein